MAGVNGVIVGISVLLGGLAVFGLLPVVRDAVTSTYRTIQIRGKLAGNEERKLEELLLADLCTNGVSFLRIPAGFLGELSLYAKLVDNTGKVLGNRVPGCNGKALGEALLALALLSALACGVLTGQLVLALLGALVPLAFVHIKARDWLRERKNKLREQLPDALRGLGMCFMAGLSLEQAFYQTAQECRDPLRKELRHTVDELHTGSSIMESLNNLDARLAMDDMRFVSVALEIQHRTGGSMREVLDAAADSILASFDLARSLEVQTAQARLSARIVSMLPLVLVAVLSLAMEGYLASFFSSAMGFGLLVCAVAMQVAGIVVIRKILGINLE